jgi:anti-anti-sigma factor
VIDLLDLVGRPDAQIAQTLRDGRRRLLLAGGSRVVVDLGDRRTLPPDAISELVLTHREFGATGGRCAIVLGPALAAQVSLAHPEGVLWAATREAAIVLLRRDRAELEVRCHVSGRRLRASLIGELDLAGLDIAEARLAEVVAFARAGREVVLDLSGLAFADVAGLRAITDASVRSQLAGARTRVTGVQPQPLRLLRRLGWQEQLPGVLERRTPARPGRGWLGRLRPAAEDAGRARREALLAELEEQFDDGREAVIATDLRGTVTAWNGAAQRLYGWSRAEAIGRPITELVVGPGDERIARQIMDSVRLTGRWEGEFEVCRKDGSTFLAHVQDAIIGDAQGRAIGLVGTSVEASRRAQAGGA